MAQVYKDFCQELHIFTGWGTDSPNNNKTRKFCCRFLIKPPDTQDENMEEKQQRVSKYETMQVCLMLSFLDRKIGNISICCT
jgi:hypothetical protein